MSDDPKQRRRAKERADLPAAPGAGAEQPATSAAAPAGEPPAEPIDAANLDEAFVKALEADFLMHGHSAIQSMRGEKPTEYVKLVAAVRGKDMNGSAADALHALSDAELDRQIEEHARDVGFAITKVEVAAAPRREEAAADEGADAG